MPTQVTIQAASLPANFCPATEQERLAAYVAAMSGSLPGGYSTFNYGNATPSASNRDKPWLRLNTDGTLDRIYTFSNGSWKARHPIEPLNPVMMWNGSAASIPLIDGGSASPDPATDWAGPFWALMDNLKSRFPMGASATPLDDGSLVSVGTMGGEQRHTLNTAELPSHTHPLNSFDTPYAIAGSGTSGSQPIWKTASASVYTTNATGSNAPHNNLPPYYGINFIKRTSRIGWSLPG